VLAAGVFTAGVSSGASRLVGINKALETFTHIVPDIGADGAGAGVDVDFDAAFSAVFFFFVGCLLALPLEISCLLPLL
tara:strand:+ start:1253 stop:1486 length:234 start_codon:yes stop_codon:yes gene_type:complete